MQVTVSRISPVILELQIEIPADTVKTEVDKAYTNLAKKAHVKGFRPGKAPRSVLSHLYGPQVQNDVANNIVNTTLPQVLTEKNVTPINTPEVEAGKVDSKETFSYKARFEVSPEIESVTYEGFELTRPQAEITDAMVDEQIERIRQSLATLKAPEPARPAQSGDIVVIDFTLSVDGKEIKDGGGQGVQLELGSKQVLPELDAGITGKNVGDKFEVTAQFPDRHPREDFRDKPGVFAITINEIKEKVLPNLDDEFAKDVGQFQTLVELRADVHTRLQKSAKDQVDTAIAEQIVEKLNEANPVEVPPSLVQQQCKLMETQILQQARRAGQPITQEQWASLHGAIHADAEKKVRAGLLMAHIAKTLEIKVTDEDLEKGIAELAEETGKNVAKVRAEYREKGKRDILIGMILEDKILDLLEGKSKIVDAAPAADLPAGTSEAKDSPEASGESTETANT
ncbi:trigger factor [Pendulispora brunnea]|uniref:Trigger factor n=1 Tax=Pendulispora brunnea TaxID=2905690 RepID=A0ABZ2KMW4_9BACT